MNGDLRVAYRASAEGPRDIVFVPNWFTCCEFFPELPSTQGWVEAMTSLGRLILFDQPGTGASDPITPGALPTLEQWADSITAVLDDLGSREAILVATTGRCRQRRCSQYISVSHLRAGRFWRVTRIRVRKALVGCPTRKPSLPLSPRGEPASRSISSIRTCRGMRRSGPRGHAWNVMRQAQEPSL